jgi:hypothetical protein
MRALYQRLRLRIASGCVRLAFACDEAVLRSDGGRSASLVSRGAMCLGGLATLAALPPRLDLVRLSDGKTVVVAAAEPDRIAELSAALFEDPPGLQPLGRIGLWQLRRGAAASGHDADLFVAVVPRLFPRGLRPHGRVHFSAASRVFQAVSLDVTPEERLRRASRIVRRNLTHCYASGVTVGFVDSEPWLERFYSEAYVPHAQRRHGARAATMLLVDQRRWLRHGGEILLLERNGEPLAGAFIVYRGPTALLMVEGVFEAGRDDREADTFQTVVKYVGLQRAHTRGCREYLLGGSPGLRWHGVFRAKRLWGARVIPSIRTGTVHWAVACDQLTEGARAAITRRGLIAFDGQAPLAVVCSDAVPPNEELVSEGLEGALVLDHAGVEVRRSPAGGPHQSGRQFG